LPCYSLSLYQKAGHKHLQGWQEPGGHGVYNTAHTNLMILGGMDMNAKDMKRLKNILLKQRREIFDRLQGLESDWDALSERDIEMEEEAQKEDLRALFDQLDKMEQKEIEDIDRALTKIAITGYGTCEKCRRPISLRRLETLPASRFCTNCAQKAE
jgi:RNA polymerase-binding transcription factor DksA